ncbi:MAG: SRPBCC family protein [Blastocatellia bacterium]
MKKIMFWILGVVGVLVLAVIVVTVIGSFLPEHHVASKTLTLRQSPETVWQVLTDFAGQPNWNSEMKSVKRLPDSNGHEVWEEEMSGMKIPLETLEVEAPKKLVRRIAADDLGFGGDWEYSLAPIEGGCQLTITEKGKVPNPMFRFMSKYIFGHTATMEAYMKSLAGKFGETPAIK